MSDSEVSSSDSEDIAITGLVATRARRANAGSLMAGLLANVDNDAELKAALAEGDEDAEGDDAASYAGSNASDIELEDSDNEEDTGPPVEGQAEDLSGEKELRKTERKEQLKKRKAKDAKLNLPAWTTKVKKVKLAVDVKAESGLSTPTTTETARPKKKSERTTWLPSPADAPTRQSARASAVQMREVTHANLRESAARSEKQRQSVKSAADREDAKRKRIELTREQRLEACKRIEKETARELGRYEREEAERQRQREAILAAKRKKGIDGAFIRHWSGSGIFEGYDNTWKLKVNRIRPTSLGEEVVEVTADDSSSQAAQSTKSVIWDTYPYPSVAAHTYPLIESRAPSPEPAMEQPNKSVDGEGFLKGIEHYAVQQNEEKTSDEPPQPVEPALPSELPENVSMEPQGLASAQEVKSETPQSSFHTPPIQPLIPRPASDQPSTTGDWPPGVSVFSFKPAPQKPPPQAKATEPPPPPPPPQPLLQEQAQRSLVLLENFSNLTYIVPERKKTSRRSQAAAAAASAAANAELMDKIRQVILPDNQVTLTPEQHRYITTTRTFKGHRTQSSIVPPSRAHCCVTMFQARYKDPKTGLPYYDMHAYKTIQRVLAGGVMWSSILGTWCGARYGSMGRPARGVPEAFSLIPPREASVKPEGCEVSTPAV